MELEELVKIVAEIVYERIGDSEIEKKNKKLILIPESEESKKKYSLFVDDWEHIDFLDNKIRTVENYNHIICPELSNKDLIDISLGYGNSQVSKLVIEGLFRGKRVICLYEGLEYVKYKNIANEGFYRIFENYKKILEDYEIEFIGYSNLSNILNKTNKTLKEKTIPSSFKIITASIIKGISERGFKIIRVSKKSMLTPLASDYINEEKIKVKYY